LLEVCWKYRLYKDCLSILPLVVICWLIRTGSIWNYPHDQLRFC
jgi:hypothetical protein